MSRGKGHTSLEGKPTNQELEFARRGGKFLPPGTYTDVEFFGFIVNSDDNTGDGITVNELEVDGEDKLSALGLDVVNPTIGMMVTPGKDRKITKLAFSTGSVYAMNWKSDPL